jgi:hypothetical protein
VNIPSVTRGANHPVSSSAPVASSASDRLGHLAATADPSEQDGAITAQAVEIDLMQRD